jgi:hypothetical protein
VKIITISHFLEKEIILMITGTIITGIPIIIETGTIIGVEAEDIIITDIS